MYRDYLDVNPEVAKALEEGRPVVALESTIIAHGMPYPKNVETAIAVEEVIKANGAVPATIGILGGRIKIGLTKEEIEYMAHAKNVLKVSRRDLPLVIAQKMDGATTVTKSLIPAMLAAIMVPATVGIGGVHRGAGESFDISADLEELKMTDVTVVCAGAKAILDIPATMEYLETAGVPVIAYGVDEIPAFYSRKSGVAAVCRLDSPEEIGALVSMKDQLGLKGGVLVTCPIPEKDEIPADEINAVIDKAIEEAEENGIKGKESTPFLLSKVKDLTEGRSLEANIKLVLNNAEIGAKIACNIK